ncbi:MAG: MoaD/ThiS family protein [Thiotrichales bacterium]
MPSIAMTRHLYQFFPQLENRAIHAPPGPVADVLRAVDAIAPGFTDYILDDRGALRRHVNVSINNQLVIDKKTLSDQVGEQDTVFIFQALSGG